MSFHAEVDAVCVHQLKQAGFQIKKRTIILPLSEGWQGWVGLSSSGWSPQEGRIHPVIGVICDEIERIYYEIYPNLPGRKYPTPTITTPIGYAAEIPEFKEWIFTNDGTVEETAADLTQAVVDIGIPYMRKNASLEAIHATLSGDNMIPNALVAQEKLAIAILVHEGRDAARTHIEETLARAADKDDVPARNDREIAALFSAYLDRTAS